MLPGTDINGAERAADKVLKGITESPYEIEGKSLYLSITIGVSVLNNTETLQNCIKRADEAMYTGKLGGKNRVVARNR
ncbi:GGDEF domain-containing protein [Marispirochaeta aestuarii]|nr:diguanylate cyclase [Marispirochaeta aestuarii]